VNRPRGSAIVRRQSDLAQVDGGCRGRRAIRTLYWTDRGDPPRGNTVNRAPMDPSRDQREAPEILWTHLEEGIGIALDLAGDRMWVTEPGRSIYLANLDGAGHKQILAAQGNLTGIAYTELPAGS
jgi:hypothetical protein